MPMPASSSATVPTRLLPTRTGARYQAGASGVGLPGASMTCRRRRPRSSALSEEGVPSATTRPSMTTASRSTAFSASSTLWVTSRTAHPRSDRARTWRHRRRRRRGSTSLVGSSRITRRPGTTVAIAKPTRRLTPPDRLAPVAERHSPMSRASTSSAVRRRTAVRSPPRIRPVSSIASVTLNESMGICACGRYEHSCRATSGWATRSCGPMLSEPDVGASRPMTCLTSVDLPAPLGPRRPYTSPGSMRSEMPSFARTPPL